MVDDDETVSVSSDEEHDDSDDSDLENSTADCDGEGKGSCSSDVRDQWFRFKLHDIFQCTEVLDCLLENIQFFLGEPITLGFFPYFTHRKHGDARNEKAMTETTDS